MNRAMNDEIETVFLMADAHYQAIASRLVKEIARLGGDISGFVPPRVARGAGGKVPGRRRVEAFPRAARAPRVRARIAEEERPWPRSGIRRTRW